MLGSVVTKVLMVLLLATVPGGCAVQNLIRHGDRLLSKGQHAAAIEKYEEALRVSPGDPAAKERIRVARRGAVRARLDQADRALAEGALATALSHALAARRMPLDLDDVNLVRRIDSTIARAASLAEARVDELAKRGHFAGAVELSQAIVVAAPEVASRAAWGAAVLGRARAHYTGLAATLAEKGLHGSAAIQLAFARKLGGDVTADVVRAEWKRFAESTCLAEPTIEVVDQTGTARELVGAIERMARAQLAALRERCGHGNRELGVRIDLSKVDVKDETTREQHAKPLPGVDIETEEVYYEDMPYTATEEYTEYETRIEKQERRDCAPRPGKPRGCRTWFEEVEVSVPVTREREVQKVRKVRKTRPISGPLPEDEVLSYQVTRVSRAVAYRGRVTLTGAASTSRAFEVSKTSEDRGNERAEAQGLVVEADPLEVESMSALFARAAQAVTDEIKAGVEGAIRGWAEEYETCAQEEVVSGRPLQAEELYLKLLALGAPGSETVDTFFEERYGTPVRRVMDVLAVALGRDVVSRDDRDAEPRRRGLVPTEKVAPRRSTDQLQRPDPTVANREVTKSTGEPGQEKATGTAISDDELRVLEAASMDVVEERQPTGTESPSGRTVDRANDEVSRRPPTSAPSD